MPSFHPLRKMEDLENAMEGHATYTGAARWMIPYADFITLLLGFFIVLFAMVSIQNTTLTKATEKAKDDLLHLQNKATTAENQLNALKAHLNASDKDLANILQD